MSRYHTYDSNITNRESLVEAIHTLGLPFDQAEQNTLKLFSYFRTDSTDPACIVIRKEALDATWNDLGFALQEDGTYAAIVGDDRREVVNQIKQEYTLIESTRALQAQGYTVTRQAQAGGVVELICEMY